MLFKLLFVPDVCSFLKKNHLKKKFKYLCAFLHCPSDWHSWRQQSPAPCMAEAGLTRAGLWAIAIALAEPLSSVNVDKGQWFSSAPKLYQHQANEERTKSAVCSRHTHRYLKTSQCDERKMPVSSTSIIAVQQSSHSCPSHYIHVAFPSSDFSDPNPSSFNSWEALL